VTFTAPSVGATATFSGASTVTVNTNGLGIAASPVPAANSSAGTYNVTATVSGVATPAAFNLTNVSVASALTIFGVNAPTQFFTETQGVEVGTKFKSDVNGMVTGVRDYKRSTDNSTHTGTLWSST